MSNQRINRFKVQSEAMKEESAVIDDFMEVENKTPVNENTTNTTSSTVDVTTKNLDSNTEDKLKSQFGVVKVEKQKKNSALSIRLPKELHDEFRECVKAIYGNSEPNYNLVMNQIIEKFVLECKSANNQ